MPFQIVRNDITRMNTQAVVNCANEQLQPTGGVSSAIFNAAGFEALTAECRQIGFCKTGSAVITHGYSLCEYVIHTAGPVWHGGLRGEKRKLKSCYESALHLAYCHGIKSIAFPLISAGSFGYPKAKALEIAMDTIRSSPYLPEMDVYLLLFDDDAVMLAAKYQSVKAYIDDNYVSEHYFPRESYSMPLANPSGIQRSELRSPEPYFQEYQNNDYQINSIEDELDRLDESFSESLLRLIDERGLVDSAVYKKANIDRKLFSKIKNNNNYKPRKNTVIAFAVALELDLYETNELLAKAGYVLTHSSKADIIIEYFIKRKIYNIYEINEALFAFDQSLLGV